jgi:hypothetical protein
LRVRSEEWITWILFPINIPLYIAVTKTPFVLIA